MGRAVPTPAKRRERNRDRAGGQVLDLDRSAERLFAMIIERLTKPTVAPFDIIALANHCRIDDLYFHDEIFSLGLSAAVEIEADAQIALIFQDIQVTLEAWPNGTWLYLPIMPMIDPLSLTIMVNGLSFNDYATITGHRPAIRLTGDVPAGLIVVTYKAGFGASWRDLPHDLLNAVMDQASAAFDMKGAGDGKTNGMSPHTARIAARYRRVTV
jgi:uncharacterized phiE125 gp8 family phage protein